MDQVKEYGTELCHVQGYKDRFCQKVRQRDLFLKAKLSARSITESNLDLITG